MGNDTFHKAITELQTAIAFNNFLVNSKNEADPLKLYVLLFKKDFRMGKVGLRSNFEIPVLTFNQVNGFTGFFH
jgi:hypothetical protein